MLLSKLFNKIPIPAVHFLSVLPQKSKIRPELSSGAPLDNDLLLVRRFPGEKTASFYLLTLIVPSSTNI